MLLRLAIHFHTEEDIHTVETRSVSFLPTSGIFVVMRDGSLTGFKVYR